MDENHDVHFKSYEIIRLKILDVEANENNFTWSPTDYDSEKKSEEKLLNHIKKNLTSRLSKQQKKNIRYKVESTLNKIQNEIFICRELCTKHHITQPI